MKKERKRQGKSSKPAGMPSRPLSAYNFFFRDERKKVLAEREATPQKTNSDLFSTMGKTIAKRWRKLTPQDMEPYEQLAKEDMVRYKTAMANYRAEVSNKKREREYEEQQNKKKRTNETALVYALSHDAPQPEIPFSNGFTPQPSTHVCSSRNVRSLDSVPDSAQANSVSEVLAPSFQTQSSENQQLMSQQVFEQHPSALFLEAGIGQASVVMQPREPLTSSFPLLEQRGLLHPRTLEQMNTSTLPQDFFIARNLTPSFELADSELQLAEDQRGNQNQMLLPQLLRQLQLAEQQRGQQDQMLLRQLLRQLEAVERREHLDQMLLQQLLRQQLQPLGPQALSSSLNMTRAQAVAATALIQSAASTGDLF